MLIYEPFAHIKPRGKPYDLPSLPINQKKDKTMKQTKLTPQYINSLITHTEYQYSGTLTICLLTLKNGYKVIGESACLNETDFDAEIGKQAAYNNAVEKIWQLEGYLAKQRIYEAENDGKIIETIRENKEEIKQILSNSTAAQIREKILGIALSPTINGIFITPKGYHLVTDKDYGDGFFIPLQQSADRYIYARKAKEQPVDGEFIYATSAEEIAACEIKAEWTIATPERVYWDSAAFLHFWNAGRLVGVDVMLQGVFAQQAETFAHLTGQEKE